MFSVYGKLNLFKLDRGRREGVLSLLPLATRLRIYRLSHKNYGNTIQYNGMAVIFCGTVCILYHTGNRLWLINRGLLFNLRLSTESQKFKVDSARWHSWSEETRRAYVKKLRDYVPTFSVEFVKSKYAGRKPGFLNQKRYIEPPTVFLNHVEEQQEEGSQDLLLKLVKSPES